MSDARRWSTIDAAAAVVGALVVAGAASVAVVAALHDGSRASGQGPDASSVVAEDATWLRTTDDGCLPAVDAVAADAARFALANDTGEALTVSLLSADKSITLARVDAVEPGTTRVVQVRLGPGAYVWACQAPGSDERTSHPWTVSASDRDGARYLPVTAAELDDAVEAYRDEIDVLLDTLRADVGTLAEVATTGDLARTRDAWLIAHLDYERMGAAYGTFGDLDGAINGLPTGLELGVDDPGFTGFRLVEHQLWDEGLVDWDAVEASTAQLVDDVEALAVELPVLFTDPADLPLRAHEILENSLQFELNGLTDQGSGTELATIRANVDGTRLVLVALTPALEPRAPELLASVTGQLDALAAALDAQRRDGTWTALDDVPTPERRRLNAMVDQLVEDLAAVPGLLALPTATS